LNHTSLSILSRERWFYQKGHHNNTKVPSQNSLQHGSLIHVEVEEMSKKMACMNKFRL
jgi:hypothetical protein